MKQLTWAIIFILVSVVYIAHYRHVHLKSWDGYNISDFQIHWYAAQKIQKGQNPYKDYKVYSRAYSYSPVFAHMISGLVDMKDFTKAVKQWELINYLFLIAMVLAYLALVKRIHPIDKNKLLIYGLPIFLTLRYFDRISKSGQVDFIILLAFLLSILMFINGKKVTSGLIFSISMLIKTQITPYFLIFFFFKRQFKFVFSAGLGFVLLSLLPAFKIGIKQTVSECYSWMALLLSRGQNDPELLTTDNQSLVSLFSYFHSFFMAYSMAIYLFLLMCGALFIFMGYQNLSKGLSEDNQTLLGFSLCVLAALMFSPHIMKDYFLFLMIPYALLMKVMFPLGEGASKKIKIACLVVLYGLSLANFSHGQLLLTIVASIVLFRYCSDRSHASALR